MTKEEVAREIESKRTPKGGFTRLQLAQWHVPWPPPPRWKDRMVRFATLSYAEALRQEGRWTA